MSDQFISVVTDEAMSRVCHDGGWNLTPWRFFISETDVLADVPASSFNADGTIKEEAKEDIFYRLRQITTEDAQNDYLSGFVWYNAKFSSLSKASSNTLTHHINIPGDVSISTSSKTIKTIFFLYRDATNQEFLYAVARCNIDLIFETGVSQSFFFNFTVTNTASQELTEFVLNYSCNHEIEDHNTTYNDNTHSFLLARDGSRQATGILEYDKNYNFDKPNQLVTLQYVKGLVNEFVAVACPPGLVAWWPGNIPPDGWTIRDGKWLKVQENPGLYELLGNRYGYKVENNIQYFQIMDDRGVFIRGCENNGNTIVNNNKLSGIGFGQLQDTAAPNITGGLGAVNAAYWGCFSRNGSGRITLSTRNGSNWGSYGTFNAASSCPEVYKNGVKEVRPINRNYLPIIKLG